MPISRIETASLDSALVAPTATALTTASGSAPSYSARAWVNFNGTGTVAIRASGNVTSITDNAVGEYTVNITTALPDANYSVVGTCTDGGNGYIVGLRTASAYSTTAVAVGITNAGVARADVSYVTLAIFR